ncbi:hypothetical protein G9A89_014062 [Geosiphon pyriformis]|nr:hypothetical protein G9A89_014062 [Geosiphon pyriformis]
MSHRTLWKTKTTCGETLLDEGMWNNIPGRGKICDKTCQYTILINDWICKRTPIDNAEGATTSELLKIKNNPLALPKSEYVLTFDVFGNIEDNPEEFYEHYQRLTPIREEQEQWLEKINT